MTIIQLILAYADGSLALMSETALKSAQLTIDAYLTKLIHYQETDGTDTEKDRQLLTEISDFLRAARSVQIH